MTTERILIVDDEETLCEVLKLNLENEGYDVDIAFSAAFTSTLFEVTVKPSFCFWVMVNVWLVAPALIVILALRSS